MNLSANHQAWICAQIGAREHFAIPRALRLTGRLTALYTDFWAGPLLRRLAFSKLRPLAARYHPDLQTRPPLAHSSNLRALGWERLVRQHSAAQTPYQGYIEVGRRFAEGVRESLSRRQWPADSIFFSYDTGALEAMNWCREHHIKCVLGQMDPNRVEVDLVRAEEKQWPGWALQPIAVPEEYFVRREQEWAAADRIVVNSEFSRQALLQQGVRPEKLVVIPLCFERTDADKVAAGNPSGIRWEPSAGPLRVLFLGQVILRKGIQYLIDAARLLERQNIQFDVVGPLGISREAMATAPANLRFHGRTDRNQAAHWYQQAQVFVLPTLSDGFAITQLEAMAAGLPVVTTPNCGVVVADGVDGFVVPPRDAASLARAFQRYLAAPELLRAQSSAAMAKAGQFSLNVLAENLVKLEAALK